MEQTNSERPSLLKLEMTTENMTKTVEEWTTLFAQYLYSDVGTRSCRVPAFHFNHQTLLTPEQAVKKNLLPSSVSAYPPSQSCSPVTLPFATQYEQMKHSEEAAMAEDETYGVNDLGTSSATMKRQHQPLEKRPDLSLAGKVCADFEQTKLTGTNEHYQVSDKHTRHGSLSPLSSLSGPPASSTSSRASIVTCVDRDRLNSRKTEISFKISDCNSSTRVSEVNLGSPQSSRAGGHDSAAEQMRLDESRSILSRNRGKRRRKGKPKHGNDFAEIANRLDQPHIADDLENQSVKEPGTFSDSDEDGPTEKKERACPGDTPRKNSSPKQSSEGSTGGHVFSAEPDQISKLSPKTASKSKPKDLQSPVQIIFPSQESMMRRDKAMTIVLDSLEILGKELEADGQEGLFVISGVNYDHYLGRIPARVLNEHEGGYLGNSISTRGILDILVLQQHVGMILVQVKSVGGNASEWQASEREMIAAVESVIQKVKTKSERLRTAFSRELDTDCTTGQVSRAFHVLALPFVPRSIYNKTCEELIQSTQCQDYYQLRVLCKEDFQNPAVMERTMSASFEPFSELSSSRPACKTSSTRNPLWSWWKSTFTHSDARLTQEQIKGIVGRICGMFSAMTVLPDAKSRREVRTFGHCVSETASRYSAPCLTVPQYELLQGHRRHVALAGPPGTGKSLLLALKAVQWLETGKLGENHVVVVNIGPTTADLPSVRCLQEAILKWRSEGENQGHVLQVAYPLDEMCPENIRDEVDASVESLFQCIHDSRMTSKEPPEKMIVTDMETSNTESVHVVDQLHFVLHDVDPGNEKIMLILYALRKHARVKGVWWSSTEPPRSQRIWSQYEVEMQSHVTRRPARVQRVLKQLEWREQWRGMYITDSSEFGLPTQGPPVRYVHHQHHKGMSHTTQFCQPCFRQHFKKSDQDAYHHPGQTSQQSETINDSGLMCDRSHSYFDHHFHEMAPLHSDAQGQRSIWHGYASSNNDKLKKKQDLDTLHHDHFGFSDTFLDRNGNVEAVNGVSEVPARNPSLPSVVMEGENFSCGHFCSPFWCPTCAESMADTIAKLMLDSVNPALSPFCIGPTKLLKDSSRNKFGEPIKPRDILILTAIPPQEHENHLPAHVSVQYRLKNLVHSTLVSRIKSQIPLKILTSDSGGKIACPKNSAVLTDVSSARGLERKVAIYVPWSVEVSLDNPSPDADTDKGTNLPQITVTETVDRHAMLETKDAEQLCCDPMDSAPQRPVVPELMRMVMTENEIAESNYVSLYETDYSLSPASSSSKVNADYAMDQEEGECSTHEEVFIRQTGDKTKNFLTVLENGEATSPSRTASSEEDFLSDYQSLKTSFDSLDDLSEEQSTSSNEASDFEEDGDLPLLSPASSHTPGHWTANETPERNIREVSTGSDLLKRQDDIEPSMESVTLANDAESNVIFCKNPDMNPFAASLTSHRIQPQEQHYSQPIEKQVHEEPLKQKQQIPEMSCHEADQLPRWMDAKNRLRKQNASKAAVDMMDSDMKQKLEDFHRRATDRNPKERLLLPRSIDHLLVGLSDVNRRGVYAAAACCLAQLVVFLP